MSRYERFNRDLAQPLRPDVAVLVYDLRGSGVVRNALRIAGACAAAGLQTELWVVRADGNMASALPPGVHLVDLQQGRMFAGRVVNRAVLTAAAIGRCADLLRARRPRVLFGAGNHVHPLAVLAHAWARAGNRLVLRASNDLFHQRRGLSGAILNPLLALSSHVAVRPWFMAADRIVAVSNELAADLQERYGLKRPIEVAHNGVDVPHVVRMAGQPLDHPWFAPGQPPVILGAGRLNRQKNFPLLIRAFARLRAHRPCRLIILGEEQEVKAADLMALAGRLGVAADVQIPGFDANPFRYMSRAGLFVLSSSWEGLSNVLIEALAAGCPIVATDCRTGTREVMDQGRYGPLAPVNDDSALADAMALRLDAPRDEHRLRARAWEFALDRSLARYVAILAEEAGVTIAQSAIPAFQPAA